MFTRWVAIVSSKVASYSLQSSKLSTVKGVAGSNDWSAGGDGFGNKTVSLFSVQTGRSSIGRFTCLLSLILVMVSQSFFNIKSLFLTPFIGVLANTFLSEIVLVMVFSGWRTVVVAVNCDVSDVIVSTVSSALEFFLPNFFLNFTGLLSFRFTVLHRFELSAFSFRLVGRIGMLGAS